MATVNYTMRIDEADKQIAEQVFKALGMTLSTGINIYLKTVRRQKKIPFDLALNEQEATAASFTTTTSKAEKEKSYRALSGILAGYEIDLDKEREERISSK